MRISLGPIPYFWERERVFDFYAHALEAPVDIVYLGETVCSKRRALRLPVRNLRWSIDGDDLTLEFELTRGAFATAVLHEIVQDAWAAPEGASD